MKFLNTLICAAAPVLAVWPVPESIETGDSTLFIDQDVKVSYNGKNVPWSFSYHSTNSSSFNGKSIVQGAISRTMKAILEDGFVPWMLYERLALEETEPSESGCTYIENLAITQTGKDDASDFKPLSGESDESYKLSVTQDGKATLEAASSTGILRGLETFSQLFFKHSDSGAIYTKMAPVTIEDKPQYDHRGILFDVARSYFSVDAILRTIDAMAMNKLNALHLHMTDSQSWPLVVPALPKLAGKGAYSKTAVYTPEDLEAIQRYGIERAVQVYIEIDTPGHFGAAALGYPEVIAGYQADPWSSYCAEPPCGQLVLNDSSVVDFIDKLMDDVLPRTEPYSAYHHAGGDEVMMNAFLLDPTVATNDSTVIQPLIQKFYDEHFARIQDAGMTPIVWEEVPLGYNVTMPKETVVQSWLGGSALSDVTKLGHKAIASEYNFWYADCGRGHWLNFDNGADFETYYPFNDWCSPAKGWRLMYSFNPRADLSDEQKELVIGGEMAMWTENIDEWSVDNILWPRGSAVGEVLWSGREDASGTNRSQLDAAPRLAEFRERMVARGISSATVYMPFCSQGMNATACEFM